jgi:hypothetical protein
MMLARLTKPKKEGKGQKKPRRKGTYRNREWKEKEKTKKNQKGEEKKDT